MRCGAKKRAGIFCYGEMPTDNSWKILQSNAENGESTFLKGWICRRQIPFRHGAREGLLIKLEAVLTRGKGSASGSRSAEHGNLKYETLFLKLDSVFKGGNGSRQTRRRALYALREGL